MKVFVAGATRGGRDDQERIAVGARRFVAQSFAAFRFARTGGPVQTEADPLDPNAGWAAGGR